jgi:hypothetical protein
MRGEVVFGWAGMKIHKFSPNAIDRDKDIDEYSSSLY